MIVTLEQPVAIICTSTTAVWCKGGCGKFRYPHCHVDGKPYCENCAFIANLNPVLGSAQDLPPKSEELITPIKRSNSQKPRKRLATKRRILEALKDGPACSKDLAAKLNLHQTTVTDGAKLLVKDGLVCYQRQWGMQHDHTFWFALPEHQALLDEKSEKPLTKSILSQLQQEPKSIAEFLNLLPQYKRHTISRKLSQLVTQGQLITRDKIYTKYYALPEQYEVLIEVTKTPIKSDILSLLKEHPRMWQKQIARELKTPVMTTRKYLDELVEEGKLKRLKIGYVFYELVNSCE